MPFVDGTPSAFRCSAVAAEILLPRGTGEAPVRFRENKLTFLRSPNMSAAQRTTDHQAIRKWIEKRGGRPARGKETAHTKKGSAGILRGDFAEPDESLEHISWDEFFGTFDKQKLAFLYQDE